MCICSPESTCLTGNVHMLKCRCKYAHLEAFTCSTESVCMLKCSCKYAHLQACTCPTGSVHMLRCRCTYAHLQACICSNGSVHMLRCRCTSRKNVCTDFLGDFWYFFGKMWHSFVSWQFKYHLLKLFKYKFKFGYHFWQCHTVTWMQKI